MSTPPVLLSLPYSPWSEKARWALDFAGVAHACETYKPLLGEPVLRRRLGRYRGVVSVPVLLHADGSAIDDSTKIGLWADANGTRRLVPEGRVADVERWIATADRGLAAGRALSLLRVLEDDEALLDLVPKSLRGLPLASKISGAGVRRTLRKYDAPDAATAGPALDTVLAELRAGIAAAPEASPRVLLGAFSLADIAMAQVLVFVKPPETPHLRLARGSRRCFHDVTRAEAFADLLAWRDALYATHR